MLQMVPVPAPVNRTIAGVGWTPTDLETSRNLSYLPVAQGWIRGKNRTYWDLNGPTASAALLAQSDMDPKLLQDLVNAEKTKARMSIISATAVSLVALLTLSGFVLDRRRRR